MISVKGDFLRCGCVRVGACREGMRGMYGECVKLEHRFGSGSRQCCTIGLKTKQPDWSNLIGGMCVNSSFDIHIMSCTRDAPRLCRDMLS